MAEQALLRRGGTGSARRHGFTTNAQLELQCISPRKVRGDCVGAGVFGKTSEPRLTGVLNPTLPGCAALAGWQRFRDLVATVADVEDINKRLVFRRM